MLVQIGPRPGLLTRYVIHRAWSQTARRTLRRTYARRVVRARVATAMSPWPYRLPTLDQLPEELRPAAEALRLEAENACMHRFDILGSGMVDLGESIDWHRDFKSGFVWPRDFYQDVYVTRLNDNSDAKVPWELSRCHHFLALARAACLCDEPQYARECSRQMTDWIAANPPGVGINWTNTMEVALRATNWVWAIGTLDAVYPLGPSLRRLVIASLEAHGRHIASNLEGSPYLRSNHYLADMVGLLAIGWALRGERHGRRWFMRARRAIEREMRLQVFDDGVAFEASTAYHGLVMEMFIIARWLCISAGQPLSADYDQRLARMLEFSLAIRASNGQVPLFGDNDSGRVLPADSSRQATHDHLLWLGSAVLGRNSPVPGVPHPEVAWTFGVEAWRELAARAWESRCTRSAFPHGGYYVLAGGGVHAVVRCGDVGQNRNGGHAHNDLLSFTLSVGEPVIVDPGTWVYTADPDARNEDRSTCAHNTVMVDGQEINPIVPDELFRLRQVAHPSVELWHAEPDATRLRVSHDGYRRLRQRVVHRRTLELDRDGRCMHVQDELLGSGTCRAETFLHLEPSVTVTQDADDRLTVTTANGTRLSVGWQGSSRVDIRAGAVSKSYGQREHASVLYASINGTLPLRFGWTIDILAGRR
jgi:hypothetical protein